MTMNKDVKEAVKNARKNKKDLPASNRRLRSNVLGLNGVLPLNYY